MTDEPFILDALDPDDYVFGIIHLPPEESAISVLIQNNPQLLKFLKKFFKRLAKKPNECLRRAIPIADDRCRYELYAPTNSDHTTSLPFTGKSSDGSYCLRYLPVRKLLIDKVGPPALR
ncbi:unnamed protein product [Protopolystoma xenopodis]|uniref:Uncharacterized protein n=1 Tax=Protopolystoma xenopodis TaxID=117903 RepID=A0A3S5CUS8_9PLAT|nr:unnamed protein product [Protopolystoma xenopodis]